MYFIFKATETLYFLGYERARAVHCQSVQGGYRYGARTEAYPGTDAELPYRTGGGPSSASPSTEGNRKVVQWIGRYKATL